MTNQHFAIDELLIGTSPAIQQVRALIRVLGPSNVPVLIQGPTGAGKELVTQALHATSQRRGSLVAFNVCAIADSLFEDALFGHVRGAFTGASCDSAGYLAEANEGTVFLDEISGLPTAMQAKLLRVIETGEYRPVGGRANRRSSFRLVSATNDNLGELAGRGLFRTDLLFRLRGAVISVPALRDRAEDIDELARHFARHVGHPATSPRRLTATAIARLERHDWPGNVRELRHTVECACTIAAPHGPVDAAHISTALEHVAWSCPSAATVSAGVGDGLKAVLVRHNWDTACVAAELGVTRKTVYERIRRFGIELPQKYRRRSVADTACGNAVARD